MAFFPFARGVPRPAAICSFIFATLILSALTWTVWQYRFIPIAGSPAVSLDYSPPDVLKSSKGVIRIGDNALQMSAAKEIPLIEFRWLKKTAAYAHVALNLSCEGVEVGAMPWDDARVLLTWFDASGQMVQGHLPLWSGRGNVPPHKFDMLIPLNRSGTLPRIIIENRGKAGILKLESFVVQPVEVRRGISLAISLLVVAWVSLVGITLRHIASVPATGWPRLALAASTWVAAAWFSCMPGPFVPWRPLLTPFPITPLAPPLRSSLVSPQSVAAISLKPQTTPLIGAACELATASTPAPVESPQTELSDSQPPERMRGQLTSWIFNNIPNLKRPLHVLGFTVLTTILCLLVGSSRAAWAGLALGGLTEFFQWAYSFGFDIGDVIDLAFDSFAVLCGVTLWQWFTRLAAGIKSSR